MFRPIHFEIHADDPKRAVKFYTSLFQWKIQTWDNPNFVYLLIDTGPKDTVGINGAIMQRMPGQSGNAVIAYVCTIEVPNVDDYLAKAEVLGGTVALPKQTVPGVGYVAYCKDTEGNIFGMLQEDRNAK